VAEKRRPETTAEDILFYIAVAVLLTALVSVVWLTVRGLI